MPSSNVKSPTFVPVKYHVSLYYLWCNIHHTLSKTIYPTSNIFKMKSLFVALLSFFLFCSCQNKPQATSESITADTMSVNQDTTKVLQEELDAIDTEDAVRWLTEVIESHLNDGGYPMEDICTPKYYQYKMDAVQVGYDGGLTDEQFRKKWSADYDIKHAGIGTGFMISGQDWGTIKVTKCVPVSDGKKGFLMLNVTIDDKEMKGAYHRDIKIVPVGKAYLIDDVVEYD
jgi:hypothetical protein